MRIYDVNILFIALQYVLIYLHLFSVSVIFCIGKNCCWLLK